MELRNSNGLVSQSNQGLLRGYLNGNWKYACPISEDDIPINSAHVICRQLGYPAVKTIKLKE